MTTATFIYYGLVVFPLTLIAGTLLAKAVALAVGFFTRSGEC